MNMSSGRNSPCDVIVHTVVSLVFHFIEIDFLKIFGLPILSPYLPRVWIEFDVHTMNDEIIIYYQSNTTGAYFSKKEYHS